MTERMWRDKKVGRAFRGWGQPAQRPRGPELEAGAVPPEPGKH